MSSSNSGQKFIRRNRPPRVQIEYADPFDADVKVELPFMMGVMSDLSGNAPSKEKSDLNERKFVDIDMDDFDKRMEAVGPGVSMDVDNRLSGGAGTRMRVSLSFKKMDDFSPAKIAQQVPALNNLLETRKNLADLRTMMDGKIKAISQLKELTSDPAMMRALLQKLEAERASRPETGSAKTEDGWDDLIEGDEK